MRTIFKKRQEYYKAVNAQKELAEVIKEEKLQDAINQTLKEAMEVEAPPVEETEETTPVKEKKTRKKSE